MKGDCVHLPGRRGLSFAGPATISLGRHTWRLLCGAAACSGAAAHQVLGGLVMRTGGKSVVATSAVASTAMPAKSAYALIGISGDAAMAKSAAAVVMLADAMAWRPRRRNHLHVSDGV